MDIRKIIKEEIENVLNTPPRVDVSVEFDFKCDKNIKIMVYKFISFISKKLEIKTEFHIYFTKDRKTNGIPTLALFNIPESKIMVYVKNRNVADVLRSVAHELVHKEQLDNGKFVYGDMIQDVGGDIEDEANAVAGAIIKEFSYSNSDVYEMNFGD